MNWLAVYALGIAVYIGCDLVDEARGRSELSGGTVVIALLWPLWLAMVLGLLIWAVGASLVEARR